MLFLKAWRNYGEQLRHSIVWQGWSLPEKKQGGYWWRHSFCCSGNLRTEGVIGQSWGLAPCGRVRITEETGRGHQRRHSLSYSRDASILELQRTGAGVQWSCPEPSRQNVCAADGRTEKNLWRPEDHEWTRDIKHWVILLEFGFALIWCALVFPSWNKRSNIFHRSPQLRDSGFLKCWNF